LPRLGGLLVIIGLTFGLFLQSGFAIVGVALMVSGGILLALAAEPLLSGEHPRVETSVEPSKQHDEIVA
jgi:small neutral amino acid transporter SnatA (MarC family)